MSFGFWSEERNLMYSSDIPNGLFAQWKNYVSPRFINMLLDIQRFNRDSVDDLNLGRMNEKTLGNYLNEKNYINFICNIIFKQLTSS